MEIETNSQETTKNDSNKNSKQTNGYDVVIYLFDLLYNFFTTGRLFAGFLFIICFYFLIIIIRFPEDKLPLFLEYSKQLLGSHNLILYLLSITLTASIMGNVFQKIIYKAEIKRLSIENSCLRTGIGTKKLEKIMSKHYSSEEK
ncbi:MAG TPA: hypothetical protein PKG52_03210 [bacterium]|nr:hypothetical protein [bacterium]